MCADNRRVWGQTVPLVACAWAFTAARSRLKALSITPSSFCPGWGNLELIVMGVVLSKRRWIVERRKGVRRRCVERRPRRGRDIFEGLMDEEGRSRGEAV